MASSGNAAAELSGGDTGVRSRPPVCDTSLHHVRHTRKLSSIYWGTKGIAPVETKNQAKAVTGKDSNWPASQTIDATKRGPTLTFSLD